MSFVINTTIDKNKELLEALKDSFNNDLEKDVYLISRSQKIAIHSFALVMASDFLKTLLLENYEKSYFGSINIMLPDICPDILKKVVEYIYMGSVALETRCMSEFIEACNLLQLKATITCERKLVFDTPVPSTSSATNQNLASIIAEFDDGIKYSPEDNTEYEIKRNDSGQQILEVYEISNLDGDSEMNEMVYEDDEHYELLNVIPGTSSVSNDSVESPKVKSPKKKKMPVVVNNQEAIKISPQAGRPKIDETIMEQAINEVITHNSSFRIVSDKYQIPKTLLWRRAKKYGYVKTEKQKDEIRIMAIESIKQGESLISLSKKFNIPISTLHREKIKLYEKGQLPETVLLKNRSRGEDYDERLRCAIAEILNGKSQNEIAKKYNIPKTTIWRIIKKMHLNIKQENDSDAVITPNSEIVQQLLELSKKRSINPQEILCKEEKVMDESVSIQHLNV